MVINRKHFPFIIPDNEEVFLSMLTGVIESVDELSSLQITKIKEGYQFRLSASIPEYNSLLIEEILKFHTMLKIHLDLSKSMKTSGTIFFKINN